MPALTRAEAETRARDLAVHSYALDLDLTRGPDLFGSTSTVRFTARRACDTFAEIRPAALRRAALDGRDLDPGLLDGDRLPLAGLTAGEHELRVEADMPYSRTGEGLHRFTDPEDGEAYVYAHAFMNNAQQLAACFDQPDLKAAVALTVTAPPHWTVLGNGAAERTAPGRWRTAATPPLPTYTFALAAGPWHSVRAEHAGLPFGLHCRRTLAAQLDRDAEQLLAVTRACFDRYHELFAEPYPYDSYDQAFVPEFNAGAMENPGLVTFRESYLPRSAVTPAEAQFRAVVVAHEMAHMWFGNLVTLRWWDDIWLNESFAEYMGFQVLSEATGFTGTWTDFAVARKAWGYDADDRPSTHPVAPRPQDVPDTASALANFDGISYAKGAAALRQLVAWLGREDFLAGLNTHFARHRFGNAALADFLDSLGSATGRDVPAWAAAWLRTSGADTLTPATPPGAPDGRWRLEVRHRGHRPHRVGVGLYDRAGGGRLVLRERRTVDIAAGAVTAHHDLPGARPDLILLNDGDLTFAKVRFDPRSWRTLRDALGGLPDPLARAVAWNAARTLVRDGGLPPARYLELAAAHLPGEDEPAVVDAVLTFCRGPVADLRLDPAARPAALAALAGTARRLLDAGRDGTRLSATRALVDCAYGGGGGALDAGGAGGAGGADAGGGGSARELRGWYERGAVPGGAPVDPELRWRMLYRLAVLGEASAADIDAELARDPSAVGREGAARCRAALPTKEAKAAAWEAMFHDDSLSNYLFTAYAQGFWQPEHLGVTGPYVERYFAEAPGFAARRGPVLAELAGKSAFPAPAVAPATLALARACLASPGLHPAFHRALTDQTSDLTRILHLRRTS